jgi:cytochrome d ubiquinol oxidase subunit II
METWDLLRNTWFILIGVLLLGYSILDGFDLGIGALFPFLAKEEKDKKTLFKAIGPFWDGNEVWLLTGGGALFAAFPHVYATVFSGFYLALMLVLFSLIFRAVSLEFRYHSPGQKGFWEKAFVFGSFLPSLLFGVALGNVLVGIPLNSRMDYTGNFFTLLRPFPLVIGLLGLAAILLQGSTFVGVKTGGALQSRARKTSRLLTVTFAVLFMLSLGATLVYIPGALKKPLAWFFALVVVTAFFLLRGAIKKEKDLLAFVMSSTAFAGLWGIAASIHFPTLVKAGNNPDLSLTIYNASSSELTLKVMLIIALIGMPFVVGYTIYLYKVFKGKVQLEEEDL